MKREVIIGQVIERIQGFWQNDLDYQYLDLVYYQGTLYRGRDVVGGIPAGTSLDSREHWEIVFRGTSNNSFEEWDPEKEYYQGDWVLLDGTKIFEAIQDVPAGIHPEDHPDAGDYWRPVSISADDGNLLLWDINRSYIEGTSVIHEGNIYRAKTFVPAGIDITEEFYWDLIYDAEKDNLLIWRYDRAYKQGDKVLVNGTDIYEAIQDVPANSVQITNTAYWKPIYTPFTMNLLVWDINRPYVKGVTVIHEGNHYRAKKDVPTGRQITDTEYWEQTFRQNSSDPLMYHDPSVNYTQGDRVLSGNAIMIAIRDVPANTPIDDTTYWQLLYYVASSIKAWDRNGEFFAGDQVIVNNVLYECIQYIGPNLGILISNPVFWKALGDVADQLLIWNLAKAYQEGINVTYEGAIYQALQFVPENTPITDQAYWKVVVSSGGDNLMVWRRDRTYQKDDMVTVDGTIYKAKINVPFDTDITNGNYWDLIYGPAPTLYTWDITDDYKAGDRAYWKGFIYQAVVDIVVADNADISDESYWVVVDEGTILLWNQNKEYQKGIQVLWNGNVYEAQQYCPQGTPITLDAYWKPVYVVPATLVQWKPGETYDVGTEVLWRGDVYEAIQDVPADINPETHADAGSYWRLEFQSDKGIQSWSFDKKYSKFDVVFEDGVFYRAIQDVPASTVQLENNLFWEEIYSDVPLEEWDQNTGYRVYSVVFFEDELYQAIQTVPAGSIAITNTAYWKKIVVSSVADIVDILDQINDLQEELQIVETISHQARDRSIDLANIENSRLNRTNAVLVSAYRNWKQANDAAESEVGFSYANRRINVIQNSITTQAEEIAQLFVAQRNNLAFALEYTRAAIGYCVDGNGNITDHTGPISCAADGNSWVNGPLSEFVRDYAIATADGQEASFSTIGQAFQTQDGGVMARGAMLTNNDGLVSGYINTNDGSTSIIDLVAKQVRMGDYDEVTGSYDPLLWLDSETRVLKIRAQLVLDHGYVVKDQNDIQGAKGDSVFQEYEFSVDGILDWHFPDRADDKYMRQRTVTIKGIDGSREEGPWGDVIRFVGRDGAETFTWVKYATTNTGDDMWNFAKTENHKFIGIAVNMPIPEQQLSPDHPDYDSTHPSAQPNGYTDDQGVFHQTYSWSKFKGDNGQDGVSQGIEVQFSETGLDGSWHSVEQPTDKWMRTRYVIDGIGQAWQGKVKIAGEDGQDGKSTYTWIKYATSNAGDDISDGPSTPNHVFIGIAKDKPVPEGQAGDAALDPNQYQWSRIKGEDGKDGENGLGTGYVFRFSPVELKEEFWETGDPSKEGWEASPHKNLITEDQRALSKYVYSQPAVVNTNGVPQVDPLWYKFTPIRIKGVDGKTNYTWIKYADDNQGNGLSNSPVDKEFIGFAYNKELPEGAAEPESLDPNQYQWSRIKGLDGRGKLFRFSEVIVEEQYWDNPDPNDPQNRPHSQRVTVNQTKWSEYIYTFDYTLNDAGHATPVQKYWEVDPVPIRGIDGQTKYTWIKYAKDTSGTDLSDSPKDRPFMAIVYNRDLPEDQDPIANTPGPYAGKWVRIFGEDGKDGTSPDQVEREIRFGPNPWFSYASTSEYQRIGDIYMWSRKKTTPAGGQPIFDPPTFGQVEPIKIVGEKGDTTFTWIAYSRDHQGTDISNIPSLDRVMMGVLTGQTEEMPTGQALVDKKGRFAGKWSRIRGTQGDKGDKGNTGSPGVGFYSRQLSDSDWTSSPTASQMTSWFRSMAGRDPENHDHMTIYNTSRTKSLTLKYRWDGSWQAPALMVTGDMVVDGAITGRMIAASQTISSPLLQAGRLQSGSILSSDISSSSMRASYIEGTHIEGGVLGIGSATSSTGYPLTVNGVRKYFKTVIMSDGTIKSKSGEFQGSIYAEHMIGDITSAIIKDNQGVVYRGYKPANVWFDVKELVTIDHNRPYPRHLKLQVTDRPQGFAIACDTQGYGDQRIYVRLINRDTGAVVWDTSVFTGTNRNPAFDIHSIYAPVAANSGAGTYVLQMRSNRNFDGGYMYMHTAWTHNSSAFVDTKLEAYLFKDSGELS